jgi:hypothetical protein
VVIQFKLFKFFEKRNEKENKNNFEKEKYITYTDGKNCRRSLSMPTAYLRRQLFSPSRRLSTPTIAVGVAYADGISGLCRRLLAVGVEISCCSAWGQPMGDILVHQNYCV